MPPDPEIILGNYLTAIQSAVPESIQTSAEFQKSRLEFNKQNDTSLNHVGVWTANVPLYQNIGRDTVLLFGGREAFLHLYVPHIQDVYDQIRDTSNHVYTLPLEDEMWVREQRVTSGILTRFDLKELFEKNLMMSSVILI